MTTSSSPIRDLLVERLEALLADCEHVMDNAANNVYLGTSISRPR